MLREWQTCKEEQEAVSRICRVPEYKGKKEEDDQEESQRFLDKVD